jgi:uncharacterized protein
VSQTVGGQDLRDVRDRLQFRTRTAVALLGICCLVAASCAPRDRAREAWPPDTGRGPCAVSKTANVAVPMRDGVILRADVYRPATSATVPVILFRTQYNKTVAQARRGVYQSPDWYASHCYLVVTQDIRGLYASDGTFAELANEQNDGYDSVEWAARLPGSNGKVGMYGASYVAATQWFAAESAPPHLVTIVPAMIGSDFYNGGVYEDGAWRLAFMESWALSNLAGAIATRSGDRATRLQVRADAKDLPRWVKFTPYNQFPPLHPGGDLAPYFFDWLKHPTSDDY